MVFRVEKYCWNAPEFWMPRSVPQIRIGILGSSASSRQKLLNLFYRETSLNEQSGRRFKKIISVCDDPYLVAVREEVGYPTDEFLRWIDVFILISDSSGSNSAAAKYFSILEKYKSAEIVVGILAAIYSISKRKSFKEAFYSLDKTSSCGKVVVNADDMTSVMDLFKEACSAHINRCVERSVSTPTASTPACAKGSTTKPFFCGSPIEIPRNISTRSAMKMGTTISTSVPVTSTPAQTGGKALKTPCVVKPCDVFNTPAAGNASSVVPQTSQQPARIQRKIP
ncbi:unnamed protein product [Orchesella dallaii]|uniref:Uncharacterized protein n=1 Tax=Orchesella dallaii TaxID=48710 RepID=A0ABP1R7Q3_9HEXA